MSIKEKYKYMNLFKNLIIFASLTGLLGCGYFSDDPVADADTYRSDALANTCEIDVEELSKILNEDVQKQIDCLETNLINFSKYVKRENQKFVTDSELKSFVRRFFRGHANLIVGSMTLIFDINSLFLKDSRNSISSENIRPLFNLLRITNKEISQIVRTIESVRAKEETIENGRLSLEKGMKSFSEEVKKIITEAGSGPETSINLNNFYSRLKDQFSAVEISPELFNGILGMKKLFLGGERNTLTRTELFKILDSLPRLSSAAFSLIYAGEGGKEEPIYQYKVYEEEIETVIENLFNHRREEEIFRDGEIEGLISNFFPEEKSLYLNLLNEYKVRILQNKRSNQGFTYKDVRNTLSLARILVKGLAFYEEFSQIVSDKSIITKQNWNKIKDHLRAQFLKLRTEVRDELERNIFFPERIEIFQMVNFANEEMENVAIPESILSILPVGKVALVGGGTHSLSKLEILNIIDKSDHLAEIFFDLNYANEENHTKQEMSGLYYKNIKRGRFLLTGQQYLHVTTVEDLLSHISKFINQYDVVKYLIPMQKFKENIIGGYPSSITVGDLAKILDLVEGYFSRNYFFDLSYDTHKRQLDSRRRIRNLRYKHNELFSDFSPEEVVELKKEFEEIIRVYRLFKDQDNQIYIGNEYKRTKEGILEAHFIQYLYRLAAKGFGHDDKDSGLPSMNIDEINEVLFLLEPVLKDLGMWSVYPETFARNVLLLADLFQSRSNGNLSMDVYEATEYGSLALFAIRTAKKFVEKLKDKKCDWVEWESEDEKIEGFPLNCYRPLFFKTLFEDLNLRSKLPKLASYIDASTEDEVLEYVISVEGFARESRDQTRPQTQKDLTLLIGAMMNIESTFLRYDRDQSNYVEPDELDEAFPVYEEAIMMLASLDESSRSYAPSIFKYMIKNMSLPEKWQVGVYHYNIFDRKRVGSKRLNIGSLLYNLILAADKNRQQDLLEESAE